MTEKEWMTGTDTIEMMLFLGNHRLLPDARRLRLFACACCREVWDKLTPKDRSIVQVAERFADGHREGESLVSAHRRAMAPPQSGFSRLVFIASSPHDPHYFPTLVWQDIFPTLVWQDISQVAAILREIFGNPFQKIAINPVCLTPTVRSLAHSIYEECDFDCLPVLADALEEAGCCERTLLAHLRNRELVNRQCVSCNDSFEGQKFGTCSLCGRETCGNCGTKNLTKHRDRQCDFFNIKGNGGYIPLRSSHFRGCWALDLVRIPS